MKVGKQQFIFRCLEVGLFGVGVSDGDMAR
jgi:hypothetical protein